MSDDVDTSQIRNWRPIVTLVVFVLTNIPIIFPFHLPIYIPRLLSNAILDTLRALRVISQRQDRTHYDFGEDSNGQANKHFVRLDFPMNFITAPLIADLFLLAISAIGRQEVHDGTIGNNNTGISPLDIILVFLCLGYIANSIEASGLIRHLVFQVLKWTGAVAHRLFLYLYTCFFCLGIFIGNDPIMLLFLFYMTRVSANIVHPRAWIHTQFAIANIATGVLVSSNPTNLVIAGAFNLKFINYTANMIVPVISTAIFLFPFLLYILFAEESLIPFSIKVHELSNEAKAMKPVNVNIPDARGIRGIVKEDDLLESRPLYELEDILNPFLDRRSAAFGAIVMVSTIIVLLVLNALYLQSGGHPDFWVTLPAAFVMFSWDILLGWFVRHIPREISRQGRKEIERARVERAIREMEEKAREQTAQGIGPELKEQDDSSSVTQTVSTAAQIQSHSGAGSGNDNTTDTDDEITPAVDSTSTLSLYLKLPPNSTVVLLVFNKGGCRTPMTTNQPQPSVATQPILAPRADRPSKDQIAAETAIRSIPGRPTLMSFIADVYRWSQETFPTATTAIRHLPFPLVPFAFSMFVLVQALVTNGWVPVFAHGWDHWVKKTGTVGSICGMGFLSVILSNFAGTNIGASILLCHVLQAWQEIHQKNGIPISDRTFWGAVYSMALGVNYGAFSMTFSASLAGIMWREVLNEQNIQVRRLDFVRVNFPIIAVAMTIGCAVLVGEVYIVRATSPYSL